MEIRRSGSQPSGKGPADWFTGTVRIDPLFQPQGSARVAGASVTFELGARTAWHTHSGVGDPPLVLTPFRGRRGSTAQDRPDFDRTESPPLSG